MEWGGPPAFLSVSYDWLRNPATLDPKDRRAFAALRRRELKTARAWALKETINV